MAQQFDELEASTEEELDALQVNLNQDDDPYGGQDGSGRVSDDVAEEQIAAYTEVGPMAEDRGGISVVPGREDTSENCAATIRLQRSMGPTRLWKATSTSLWTKTTQTAGSKKHGSLNRPRGRRREASVARAYPEREQCKRTESGEVVPGLKSRGVL